MPGFSETTFGYGVNHHVDDNASLISALASVNASSSAADAGGLPAVFLSFWENGGAVGVLSEHS